MIEITRNGQVSAQNAPRSPEMPFTAVSGNRAINNTPNIQTRPQRQLKPFTAIDGSDYRRAYRAVCDFHERHNPPRLDNDSGDAYWAETTDDWIATCRKFEDDAFIMALMIAVLNELERQFKLLRDGYEADNVQYTERTQVV